MRAIARVVIIGPSNVGDAILASDVIAAICGPEAPARITLVVGERARVLFDGDTRIHTLLVAEAFASPLGRLRLAGRLWRERPHVVVDLRQTLYPLFLKPLSAWRYLRRPPARLVHMRDRQRWRARAQAPALFAGATGHAPPDDGVAFWTSAQDEERIEQLWRRWGLTRRRRLIVICPGARSHIKRWGAEGFARVADRLIGATRAQVVLSGEPGEHPIVEEILGRMRHPAHSAVGLTTVRQAAVLMRRADLVITNDSASLHLASAVRAPTVAIFGPTDARKYGPTSPRHRVVRRRLFCAPCEQALCRFSHECMRFITPEEVVEAARALLTRRRAAPGARPTPSR